MYRLAVWHSNVVGGSLHRPISHLSRDLTSLSMTLDQSLANRLGYAVALASQCAGGKAIDKNRTKTQEPRKKKKNRTEGEREGHLTCSAAQPPCKTGDKP